MHLCLIPSSLLATSFLDVAGTLFSALKAFIGLGLVIFVHELGHFLVAKACGVKCEKFYLGFDVGGWKILHFQWGETEYGIGAIPLGGYVKMLGQDDNPSRAADERERSTLPAGQTEPTAHHRQQGDLPAEPVDEPHAPYDPRSYMAKSVPQRMAIISAGVIMNLIFAVIFAMIAYHNGVRYVPTVIGGTSPGDPAWVAGLNPGDKAIRFDDDADGPDERLRFFQDLLPRVMFTGGSGKLDVTIRRYKSHEVERIVLRPTDAHNNETKHAVIGVIPGGDTTLAKEMPTIPGSPADKAKFAAGDKIVAAVIDGQEQPIDDYVQLQETLARYYDRPIDLIVERRDSEADAKAQATKSDAPELRRVKLTLDPEPMHEVGIVVDMGPLIAIRSGSPAAAAGFKIGDRIVSVDGHRDLNPLRIPDRLAKLAGHETAVEVLRKSEGKEITLSLKVTPQAPRYFDVFGPNHAIEAQEIGVAYEVLNSVKSISSSAPAEAKQLAAGDMLLSAKLVPVDDEQKKIFKELKISEKPIPLGAEHLSWPYVQSALSTYPAGIKVALEFVRGKKTETVEIPTVVVKDCFAVSSRGLVLQPLTEMRPPAPWSEAFWLGVRETRDSIWQVTTILRKLVSGDVAVTNLGGIGTIAVAATASASEGVGTLLLFLTLLSANLAVLNILPIPVLDGGHLVLLLYEGIRGKPASEKVVTTVTYAGLIFILTLMVFVMGLDITRLFSWLFNR